MPYKKDEILKALSNVIDPDLNKDLVTLNMIQDLEIEDHLVKFSLVLTTPACPLKETLERACVNAINHFVDKDLKVDIHTTANVTSKRDAKEDVLPDVRNIIAVASGKGGVGKSTVTANLAIALAKNGAKVGLMDADIYGPSMPMMFDLIGQSPKAKQIDGKNFMVPIEKYGVKVISIGFFMKGDQAVPWRGPMASSAIRQFINETCWDELDYLVIDLPPGTGDIHLTIVSASQLTGAVIVTTPQEVALADARKAIDMFKNPKINVPVLGLIENMSYFSPPELPDKKYHIFGKNGGLKLADNLKVPLLGQVPIVESICDCGDNGKPVVLDEDNVVSKQFMQICEKVAQQVAIQNAKLKPSTIVESIS